MTFDVMNELCGWAFLLLMKHACQLRQRSVGVLVVAPGATNIQSILSAAWVVPSKGRECSWPHGSRQQGALEGTKCCLDLEAGAVVLCRVVWG
jgi:hypothetical protein